MKISKLAALLCGASFTLAGTASAAVWTESGDAGDFIGTAPNDTTGASMPLTNIFGATGAADGVDTYIIEIADPDMFYATTNPAHGGGTGTATFDTRLFMFALDGTGILGNDDAPSGAPFASMISDPADWVALQGGAATGGVDPSAAPFAPGAYILAVTGWTGDPGALDAAGGPVIDQTGGLFDDLVGSTGGPLDSWTATGEFGDYSIELGGVVTVPEPSSLGLLGLALIPFFRRRR